MVPQSKTYSGRDLDAEVARLVGWKNVTIKKFSDGTHSPSMIVYGNKPDDMPWPRFWLLGQATSGKSEMRHVPRFSTSIADAMEVENRIIELNLTRAYCDELYIIVAQDKGADQVGAFRFDLIHATAEQRCRAALAAVESEVSKSE